MKPTKFGVGQRVKRVEDVRLVSGRGNYRVGRGRGSRTQGGLFAQSPWACQIPHRGRRGRARGAGRPRRVCRERFRRTRRSPLRRSDPQLRRVEHAAQALSGDGGKRGPSCRRHRRDGGRRYDVASARRRRIDQRRLGRASRRRRHGRSRQARSASSSLPARPAMSPTIRISATGKRRTPHSTRRRTRSGSRSSIRGRSQTTWSRVRRSENTIREPADSR